MKNWLSIHVFPKETLDDGIVRWLGKFMAELQKSAPGEADYFFVRSLEDGPHFRLRLGGGADFFQKTAAPLVAEIFERQAGAELAFVPYQPEIGRFGGAESYSWSEMHFMASSQMVFRLLAQPGYSYENKLGDALRLHICFALAAGFTRREAAAFFNGLKMKWMPAFFATQHPMEKQEATAFYQKIENSFAGSFSKQESGIRELTAIFWKEFSKNEIQPEPDEWDFWLKMNRQTLPNIAPEAWGDLIHLTNNRLGITNQDEVFVNFLLAKCL